jgi:transposase
VILDNNAIHRTEQVTQALATSAGNRIELHFLPPYCPDHNKIERTWQDFHVYVTRNHRCKDMAQLMKNARYFLRKKSKQLQTQYATAA